MRESVEERITMRIREVMQQYEPDYSPSAWEKLRKHMAEPEFRFKKLMLKYKFWLSCLTIAGVLIIVYKDTDVLPANKYPEIDTVFSASSNNFLPEKPKETGYTEKNGTVRFGDSDTHSIQKWENRSSDTAREPITEFYSASSPDYNQTENAIEEIIDNFEQIHFNPVSLSIMDKDYQHDISRLIVKTFQPPKIPVTKPLLPNKTKKFKIQWPGSNSAITDGNGYDRFTGPNKLVFYYSTEIHSTPSYNSFGISNGAGFSLEGPIRSSISISAGLSYQSINFDRTIFSEKVYSHNSSQYPTDTIDISELIDSTGIISGSYNYLELPVAVNFKFLESPRSQIWLSAGISAIAFLEQNYNNVTIVGGISDSSSVSVKAWENIHPLASFNIGLLYRYKLSDRFFLHGSAQYKQHLVPLGYNSMKLNRLNFQAGITYRFGH
jgi:hypothetical protein